MLTRALTGCVVATVVVTLTAVSFAARVAADTPYLIVVHPSNPTERLTTEQISELFLRKRSVWPSGVHARPIDLAVGSPVRDLFSLEVHGRPSANVKSLWTQLVFAGELSPPLEVESEREVIERVSSAPGAIGYVSAATDITGLHEVEVILPPRQRHQLAPFYPEAARRARVQGDVILQVTISARGTVDDATVQYGLPFGLSEAAVTAVRQWRFDPATTRDGQAVECTVELAVKFEL